MFGPWLQAALISVVWLWSALAIAHKLQPGAMVVHYGTLGTAGVSHHFMSDGHEMEGDLGQHVTFCSLNAEFICIRGDQGFPPFAVPKRPLKVGDTWAFAGRVFRVEPQSKAGSEGATFRISVLGVKTEVALIRISRKPNEEIETAYFWSTHNGVVAICNWPAKSPANPSDRSCTWLEGEFGVGSAQFEVRIPESVRRGSEQPTYLP